MTQKRLEMLTKPWFSEWKKLLNSQLAIRSIIEFDLGSSTFETELTFTENGIYDISGPGVYRAKFVRTLGDKSNIRLPATVIGEFHQPLETFLNDLYEREFATKSSRIADLCLEPVPHVATVIQLHANEKFLLPPSHPLLLLHYGMIYEGIVTRRKHPFDEGIPNVMARAAIWDILKRRFGAFLWQQETISAANTLGQIP